MSVERREQVTYVGMESTGNRRNFLSWRKPAGFHGWHEPDESRDSRPDLWEARGAIPRAYPAPQLEGNARSNEDGGIGVEPNNPRQCSEVADGVARQSEGIAQLSLPCFVRQGVSQGRSDIRLRVLQSQGRSGRSGQADVRGHRDVRSRALAGRTGARAEKPNLSTTSCAANIHTEAGRETAAARSARDPGSDSGDGSSSGSRTHIRSRPAAGTVRLSARPQRTGRSKACP